MSTTSRYAEVVARTEPAVAAGGAALLGAITLSLWGNWRGMTSVIVLQALTLGLNTVYNRRFIDRLGPTGDTVHLVLSGLLALTVGHLAHWSLPVWFTLPYTALVTDASSGKRGVWSIFLTVVAFDVVGCLEGAPWTYPAAFSILAWFSQVMLRNRSAAMRAMLVQSEAQHAELARAHRRLKSAVDARDRMEVELRQAQKLEAMGRLAAGVAHEINTPVQFVSDSLLFVKSSFEDLVPLVRHYQVLREAATKMVSFRNLVTPIVQREDAADIEYVIDNLPGALERSLDGLQRITTIVKSLKEFAHPDSTAMCLVDLNRAIESTLTIASHEYKLVADIALDLHTVPAVTCHAGEINQVVLNIVVNAAHAIEDVVRERGGRGKIAVTTTTEGEGADAIVLIEISDSGDGIPESVRDRIFDPFFTTKEVGKGTGQGLAISKTVIEKHGGKIHFETAMGKGTTFVIRLPITPPPLEQSGAYCVVPVERAA